MLLGLDGRWILLGLDNDGVRAERWMNAVGVSS